MRSLPKRSLRVGVLLGDHLVEERVFDGSMPVTIGQSLKSALSIPADGVPALHVLFACDEGRWLVRPLSGADVPIAARGRGKIRIGDATILYQEVTRAPVSPRPQLPASVRGTLGDRIDARLAVILGASLALHAGFAIYASLTEVDDVPLTAALAALEYHQDTMEVTLPDEPPITTTTTEPTGPGTALPVRPTHSVTPVGSQHIANELPDPAKLHEDAVHMADLLVGPGTSKKGTPGDMSARAPGADLRSQIDQEKGKLVTIGDPTHTRTGDEELAKPKKGTAIDDPTLTHQDHTEVRFRPIQPGDIKVDTYTTLTADAVLSKINGLYMAGLQRCYAKGLARDATLAGRVTLKLTVSETGRIDDADARGLSDEVDQCIAGQMASWVFPPPHTAKGDATQATFAVSLALAK